MPLLFDGIQKRFFSLFPNMPQKSIVKLLGAQQAQVSRWQLGKESIPWSKLEFAVETKNVTWDWLLEGRLPKYRGDANETTNPNRNAGGIPVETNHLDGINDEKGDMSDTTVVDALNDHIETLKQQNARLQAEVESLREENKHLLTVSPERDTRQAKSG